MEIKPPETLLKPCFIPYPQDVDSLKDIIWILDDNVKALAVCAAKVDALIEYYKARSAAEGTGGGHDGG